MNHLEQIRIFVTLVECQSSTKAADKLGIAISAITRRMKELEGRLGVQLLQRTTRRMHVTEDGVFYYQRCKQILEDLDETESQVKMAAGELSGTIKVATPLSFGIGHLSSAMSAFMHLHEQVTFDIDMSDRQVDIIDEGFDLALRIGQLEDSSFRARKLAEIKHVVCCSPSLLKRYGPINHPNDLKNMPVLCYSNIKQPTRWRYKDQQANSHSVSLTPRMLSNNGDALNEAAIAGLGVICGTTFISHRAIAEGLLVPVLTEYKWFDMNLYAIYPQTRYLTARVRAFIDYLISRFGEKPYWDQCFHRVK